jgi:hypothetical protein
MHPLAMKRYFLLLLLLPLTLLAQKVEITEAGYGWAKNSVNTVIFRKNALISLNDTQFIAYYDSAGKVMVGKRQLNGHKWELQDSGFTGNVKDAHCSISLTVDGEGYLHLSWDHHGNPLRYAKSKRPFALEFGPKENMTGENESNVTYPEFFRMPNGNLLFMYRDGASGRGNLVMKTYSVKDKRWSPLHTNLISGENQRNAYWQGFVDANGLIHLSWVWRETPDVATNHDMCYARSKDGGLTWETSTGRPYTLPITASSAEIIYAIPQKSELINQTSMFADHQSRPFIATYWRDANSSVPQYRLIYTWKGEWKAQTPGQRSTPFSLSGVGTKRIPISRPQVVGWGKKGAIMVFRDEERGGAVSVASNKNLKKNRWKISDLLSEDLGSWEPSFDTELWKNKQILSLYVQHSQQTDAEGQSTTPAQRVRVVDWKP